MKKKILVAALVLLTVILGFLRDYIFVSINQVIKSGAGGNLSTLKWVLTFFFSFLYLLITCLFVHILFKSKKYVRIAVILYAILFAISFIAASLGYFFSSFENSYHFVRTVMGIAQSPVVAMILVSACYLETRLSAS